MEMGDQYGLADLRQFMTGRPHFPAYPPLPDQFPGHRNLTTAQHYEMMLGSPPHPQPHHHQLVVSSVADQVLSTPPTTLHDFRSTTTTTTTDHSTNTTTTTNVTSNASTNSASTTTTINTGAHGLCGLEMDGCNIDQVGNGRWPRQETLTLLEIRSRLDSKFKEANQKGPLWDEVSRIMAEQHGYQRSGKKCREKFENLYKYYKKTKEGKSGRQDGKHYRFFRQLEALYGDNTNPLASESYVNAANNTSTIRFQPTMNNINNYSNQETILQTHHQKLCESQSISISSEFDTSSSEDNDNDLIAVRENNDSLIENNNNRLMKDCQSLKRGRKTWKAKIREFIDSQMKKLIDTQEAWLEKMLRTLEQKEQERMLREEEWRKQEEARINQEHKFWAKERAWFEARDAALMEALKKFTGGKELIRASSSSEEIIMAATTVAKHQENMGNCNYSNDQDESEVLESTVKKNRDERWEESEISSLIHIRSSMESRFQQEDGDDDGGGECSKGALWEEISVKLACLGYDRSSKRCKEKWENINKCLRRRPNKERNKKRKENAKLTSSYFYSICDQEGTNFCARDDHDQSTNELQGPHETLGLHQQVCGSNNAGTAMHDSCFRFLMGEAGENNLWENYCTAVKFNKEENQ